MGKLRTVTGIAPSHWASYLINGDSSSFQLSVTPSNPDAYEREIEAADKFAAWLGGHIVDANYYGFKAYHDARQFGVLAADCDTYTALINDEKKGK